MILIRVSSSLPQSPAFLRLRGVRQNAVFWQLMIKSFRACAAEVQDFQQKYGKVQVKRSHAQEDSGTSM